MAILEEDMINHKLLLFFLIFFLGQILVVSIVVNFDLS